jgi:eukaryotic-like serine/threonine-protein kinase
VKLFTWAAGLPAEVVLEFTRDVMRVADLHHPSVAQVFDAGMLGDGTPFVVMERLRGMTLDEATAGRALPIAEVLPILRGIGSALSAAHARGIAHGQVRANNVFIADPARHGPACAKLLDFGVARLEEGWPERGRGANALGQRAAERADQLALAAVAWRLLGPTSAPVQLVLLRAMSPDPSQRFGSVRALVDALEEASTSASAPGLALNARAVKTLAGPAFPVSPSRPTVAVVVPPTGPAAVARAPIAAPPPALAGPPSSLTQQFFAEGEQLEKAHAAGQTSDAGSGAAADDEDEFETAAATRVPRSRAQMTAAALLALGSVALIGWTVVSLADKPEGGSRAADTSPPAAVVRPVGASPAGAPRPARTTDRGPGEKTIQARRASIVLQPPPFTAPARPSVTASEAPASPRMEVPTIQAPRPWVESPSPATEAAPVGAAASPGEPFPSTAPIGDNDDATQPEPQTGDEGLGAGPAASTADATAVAPAPSDDVSRAPSTTRAPAPSESAPPTDPQ